MGFSTRPHPHVNRQGISHDFAPGPPTHLTATFDGDLSGVATVREEVRGLAVRAGFGERANDVALALAELLANAVEHGTPPVRVDAWWDGRLVVEVADVGTGLDRDAVWRSHPPSPQGDRGRGLWIVRQLMDVVIVHCDADGTRIHVELSPEPHIGA